MDSKIRPNWLDPENFARGRKFFVENLSAILFSWYCALMVGFAVPALSESLLFSKATSNPENSRRRYLATLKHLLIWHLTDIFDPEAKGQKSITEVRAMHDKIRKELDHAFPSKSGLHISQNDLKIVQSGFIGPVVLYPEKLGIRASKEELSAYVHFWRVIGWFLGIEDDFNCCESLEIAQKFAKDVEQEIIVPNMRDLKPKYSKLRSDFVNGFQEIGVILTENSVLSYVSPQMGLESPKLTSWSDLKAYLCLVLHSWLQYFCPFYRNFCNQRLLKMMKL